MIDALFFDSDCISAFLWVQQQSLLALLYPRRIIIPKPVYDELSFPATPHLKQRLDCLINNNQAHLETINIASEAYSLYYNLTTSPGGGRKVIGPGEAAAIALAKTNNGIVASNNLKDISPYISEFKLKHITTGDILVEAMEKGHIIESQGNTIWASMLAKRRKLGATSFSEYIRLKR